MPELFFGPSLSWRIYGGRLLKPAPFLVAGIVNITPDSFSDGGNFFSPEKAGERVRQVVAEGAQIVDLGAESTRPGADDIGTAEEWRRLAPVLEICMKFRQESDFAVSIDTFRAETAAAALSMRPRGGPSPGIAGAHIRGADIINDISGGMFDPGMAEVVGSFKPGYILGHSPALPSRMQDNPHYDDVVEELLRWFEERMAALIKAGLPEDCISLDPCIGFGKNLEHNLAIIKGIPRFAALGRPLFFGISRKSILGELTGLGVEQRGPCTQVLTALIANAGVSVHRAHDVAATMLTLKIVRAVHTRDT